MRTSSLLGLNAVVAHDEQLGVRPLGDPWVAVGAVGDQGRVVAVPGQEDDGVFRLDELLTVNGARVVLQRSQRIGWTLDDVSRKYIVQLLL